MTPEEIVRQNFIRKLIKENKIPELLIEAEIHLSKYKKGAKKRVDILVSLIDTEDNFRYPLIVIECKAPDIPITDKVDKQMDKYIKILNPYFYILTNGYETYYYGWDYDRNKYREIQTLPTYKKLIKHQDIKFKEEVEEHLERPKFDDSVEINKKELLYWGIMGEDTDDKYVSFITNISGLLLYDKRKAKNLPLKTKQFKSDNGLRYTSFGMASGGAFTTDYKYFLVENENGETEIVSITILGKLSGKSHPEYGNVIGYTVLQVAIDDFEQSHISLQYAFERFVEIEGDKYSFWHDGTLTLGKKGRVKNKDVVDFITLKAPHLIKNGRIFLGTIRNDREFTWEIKDFRKLIANFIDYAFVRDEYRRCNK